VAAWQLLSLVMSTALGCWCPADVAADAGEVWGLEQRPAHWVEHVVGIKEKTLAAEYPDRLASQHALAGAYKADGQVHKAVALFQHVFAVEARTLREDHSSRLVSVKALADMLAELAVDSDEASSVSCESSPVSWLASVVLSFSSRDSVCLHNHRHRTSSCLASRRTSVSAAVITCRTEK
jgi:hypothetical protein